MSKAARCACGFGGWVVRNVHRSIKAVSSSDLVKMRGVDDSRVDQRIDTVNDQLGACESQVGSTGAVRKKRRGNDGGQLHGEPMTEKTIKGVTVR